MIPADPVGPLADGCDLRLADPGDVEFALKALLDSYGLRRSTVASLPRDPTVGQLVDAVFDQLGPEREAGNGRRRARRLLAAYFAIDPPLPAAADAGD